MRGGLTCGDRQIIVRVRTHLTDTVIMRRYALRADGAPRRCGTKDAWFRSISGSETQGSSSVFGPDETFRKESIMMFHFVFFTTCFFISTSVVLIYCFTRIGTCNDNRADEISLLTCEK